MEDQKLIFVVGTGRSGTHWVGYLLQAHPDIHTSIEKPEIFDPVTSMALNPSRKKEGFLQLINLYKKEQERAYPKHYADKSHPNLWHAEDLAKAFPNAKFIGIYRNPYATVASMLKHPGVLEWYKRWKEYPVPNQFLGITTENADSFDKMSLAAKCALRWQSHKNKLDQLKATLNENLHVISYEMLTIQHEMEINRLKEFLGLSQDFPQIDIKKESLDKWKKELSPHIYHEIKQVLGFSHEEFENGIDH